MTKYVLRVQLEILQIPHNLCGLIWPINVCFIKTDALYLVVTYIKCIRFSETDIRFNIFVRCPSPISKRFYYRRPRHSYYTMKAKQEPVSRFDISWYTWAENFVYCLFLRFCWQFLTWLIASAELTAVFWQAKGNKSDLKKTFYIPLPVVNCLLKNNLVF